MELQLSEKKRKIENCNADNSVNALDLSCNAEDEVDILSIDPPSPSNVEQWSVEKVAEFVSNVETCREYAQVINSMIISSVKFVADLSNYLLKPLPHFAQ